MRFVILISILMLSPWVMGQRNYEFSPYPEKYIFELKEFYGNKSTTESEKDIAKKLASFELFWNSDSLSTENKLLIIKTSNLLSAKNFNPNPSFNLFIQNVLAIHRNVENKGNFEKWMQSIQFYIQRKRVAYLHQYFEYSLDFFGTYQLFNRNNKIWKISPTQITILEEDNNPIFKIKMVNLIGTSGKDSSCVWGTSGLYYPLKQRWEGTGGTINWARFGIDTLAVYARLEVYKIDLTNNLWRADSVTFYDKRRFDYSLLGRIRDNFGYTDAKDSYGYPAFSSYRTDITIKDVYPNVDYRGGYALQGLKVIGSAEGDAEAYFIFKHKEKPFVYTGSKAFIIEEDKIISEKVSVTIYLESLDSATGILTVDSIFHPGLSLYYSNAKKHLSIYRKEEGLSKTPFFDSYHNIDLYVEELGWKMGEDFIDMKSLQQKGIESKAYFESINMFSDARYDKLQGLDEINPVTAVYNYTKKVDYNEFHASDFGYYMKLDKAQTIDYLLDLASKGFLLYDLDNDYVIVKENVRTYELAHQGRTDYDVIGFNSYTDGSIPNASLNLRNNEIIIQGVSTVHLSDSQDVRIYPKHGRVVLKKNRDFEFDGKIIAGRFDLYARKCYFSYDKFELELPTIDSLSFKVVAFEENQYGEKPLVRVKTVIERLSGNILIDHPNNKSGLKKMGEYPILNSKSRSYVYYDKASIFNKVYDRENFFYRLESFTIDSLDDFKTEGLQFEGYLASAGIFPDIEQPLMVQPDYSLGFVTVTEASGLPMYSNKGLFNDTIRLSNNGLRGSGELKYLTSISKSNDFFFFPDSTKALAQSFEIVEQKSGTEYPPVIAQMVKQNWMPKMDKFYSQTTKKELPFKMYTNEATMLGQLTLQPTILNGNGVTEIKNAVMESKIFDFKNRYYQSDSCLFALRSFVDVIDSSAANSNAVKENSFSYKTEDNFKARVDFDLRKGEFESTTGSKPVIFDENQYMCYMDQFVWYMDEDKTEFGSKDDPLAKLQDKTLREQVDLDLSGTQFISIHPAQDSLSFFANRAVFYQRRKLIHATGVPFISVADASIFPGDHEADIRQSADLKEFTNSQLLVNRETKYHEMYNGTFKVHGNHNYNGRALYDYKDEDGNIQNIFFGKIDVDTAGFTVAIADIEANAQFTLSRYFDFVGSVTLLGGEKFLTFNGGTRISHNCDTLARNPIQFTFKLDPSNIMIPIGEEVKDIDGVRVFTGLKSRTTNGKVYASFLNNVGSRTDNVVMQSQGFLVYDKISNEYRIASADKLSQRSLPGNYLSLSKRECSVYAEGELNLGFNLGAIEGKAYGKARYFGKEDSTTFDVSLPLDFFFNEKALELFANQLNSRNDLSGVNLENDVYSIMLGNKLGAKLADETMSKIITNGGEYKRIPKELTKTIFISDVKMKYNSNTRSLVSTDHIGIVSLGKDQVLKYVEGKLEIQNKGETYKITLAIDLGNSQYYIFQFKGNATTGQVLVYSTNEEFNTLIKETKADDRKLKTQGKEPKFNYYIGTPTDFKKFMRQMEINE